MGAFHRPLTPAGTVPVGAVQHDGHRPVVQQRDLHVLLENTGGYGQAGLPEKIYRPLIKPLGLCRGSSVAEIRAAAFAGVGAQSKLAHYQKLRSRLQGGVVEMASVIGKYSEVGDLVHQI